MEASVPLGLTQLVVQGMPPRVAVRVVEVVGVVGGAGGGNPGGVRAKRRCVEVDKVKEREGGVPREVAALPPKASITAKAPGQYCGS